MTNISKLGLEPQHQPLKERLLVNIWVIANVTNALTAREVAKIRTIIDEALIRERGESETNKRHRERMEKLNREDSDLLWEDGD